MGLRGSLESLILLYLLFMFICIQIHTYTSIYKCIDIDIDIGPTVVTELTNIIDLDRHPTS